MCIGKLPLPEEVPSTAHMLSYKLVGGFSHQPPKPEGWCFFSGLRDDASEFFSGLEDGGFGKPLVIQRVVVSNSLNFMF